MRRGIESASIPGPLDRETFFAAQARNRRAAGRLTALAGLGVALMGVPMSAVISPLVYAALLIVNDLVSLAVPSADLVPLLAHLDRPAGAAPFPDAAVAAILIVALVLPGSLAMLLAWLGARALFLGPGEERLLRTLGARSPRPDDLEERQVQNLVEEMGIAAGVRPPRVAILDGTVANAGAVGAAPDDATPVVSRRLLDELDRDESQGVIAQLVGSVGNGDLRAALAIISMHRAFGLVMAVLGAPFGPHARRTLLRIVRLGLRRGRMDPAELDSLDAMLAKIADGADGDIDPSRKTTLLDVLRLPFMLAQTAFWMCRLAFVSFVVGPLLALAWRSRRYLADATAVQLTRNPDGVARGLRALAVRGGVIPGGSWAAPLFVIGPASGPAGGFKGDDFGFVSFSPPAPRRLERLRRQSATVEPLKERRLIGPVARAILAAGVLLMGTAILGCALALTGIALVIDMLILTPIVFVIHGVLR
jgi:Zn-dependent protease with chaperone function